MLMPVEISRKYNPKNYFGYPLITDAEYTHIEIGR